METGGGWDPELSIASKGIFHRGGRDMPEIREKRAARFKVQRAIGIVHTASAHDGNVERGAEEGSASTWRT